MRSIDELFTELVRLNVKLWGENGDLRYKAPQGVLTPTLRAELVQRKAEILTFLQKTEALPQVVPAPEQRYLPFPLTDVQYAYWVGRNAAFALGNIATHNYNEFEFADLDLEKLNWGWQQLIARHGMLRMIVQPDGQQRILQEVPSYKITVLDLRGYPEAEVQSRLAAIRAEMSHQVFAPDVWPLFDIRATLLDEQPGAHRARLHISLELMLVDISSVQRLLVEWGQFYQQPMLALPALELSFRDYVVAAEQLKTTELYRRSEAYWLRRVDTLPPAPDLPMVQRLDQLSKPQFKRHSFQLAAAQWQALKQKANQAGLTPSETLLTVFADVLHAWSSNPRFTLNVTLFHRLPLHPQVDEIIGDFTGINLLEIDHSQPGSFVERAKRIQQQLWQDLDHRYFSGIRVLRAIARQRESSGGALMPVVFTSALALGAGSTGTFGQAIYGISQTSQVWLDHQVMEQAGALHFNWDAVEELFPVGLLDDMFTSYCACLERLALDESAWTTPGRALLPGAQAAQRAAVNNTTAPMSQELLHTLFLHQVAVQGEAVAVITPEGTLTYQALYQRANQVGHWLRARGAAPNTLVAVVMAKGWEQVVGVLGVLMAGAAYLPIDPELPSERQHYLLTQGEVTLVLTQAAYLERLAWPTGIECLAVDRQTAASDLSPLPVMQTPTDLAYVIYTSGSTGLPKGVAIDHRGAVNTVLDINRRFSVNAQDRVLALSALNFDLSVYDIFGLLAAGGCIVFPSAALRSDPAHWLELMVRHSVTVWNTVPALMQMLVEYLGAGGQEISDWRLEIGLQSSISNLQSPLRLSLLSGDWIPVTLPDQVRALWPASRVVSLGGATEASIWSIYYPIDSVDPQWASIPYGQPLTNQTFHVLDEHFNPRPIWAPGHLYIGGIGLARAYWRDPAKTAERFIHHPQTGERLYQTGDLGRYLPDGNIEFLGRADFQVKIRGHRIELGEIEATLLQHPGVKEAAVNAVGDPKGARQLIAYLVPVEDPPTEADSLFAIDTADEAVVPVGWTIDLLTAAQTQEYTPAYGDQTAAFWQYSNQLYLDAICRLFAGFGLFQNSGERHTLDEVMTQTGSAPRYRKWMRRALQALVENGWLQGQGDEFVCLIPAPASSPALTAALPDAMGQQTGAAWLLQSAEHLTEILTERIHSAQLYAADEVPAVYQQGFHQANALVAAVIEEFVRNHQGPLRILEVGAGYGSTTRAILPIISAATPVERTTYHFTDISQFFLQRAQTEFAAYPFLQYSLLDLEAPPASQGYALHTYDLILAASVLHVPRRVAETLQHVRSLLAPGGLLVMIEETHFQPAFDLSMGLQQGFERFEDLELRPLHPLLTSAEWQHCLQTAGFVQSAVAPGNSQSQSLGIDVLIAQGPLVVKRFAPDRLRAYLAKKLPDYMLPATYVPLERLPLTSNGKVDRKALPVVGNLSAPSARPLHNFVAPRTVTEQQLAAIWRAVLQVDPIGIHENFFAVGGDSLLATQVLARLRQTFQVEIPLSNLFKQPTIAQLATLVEAQELAMAETATLEAILAEIGEA